MRTPFKLKGGAKDAVKKLFSGFDGIKKGAISALGNGFVKGAKKAKK